MSSTAEASEEPEDSKNFPEPLRWILAKESVVGGHNNQKEAAEKYGLSYDALRKRCEREQWAIPERVLKAVTELSHNRILTKEKAENWSEKAELHKILAFEVANAALSKLKDAPLAINEWRDADIADKMARRAVGLDNDDSTKVNNTFNFAMLGDSADEIQEISVSGGSEAV